jgi:choline/glycine/proline betaine transport protein
LLRYDIRFVFSKLSVLIGIRSWRNVIRLSNLSKHIDPQVFIGSSLIIFIVTILGSLAPETAKFLFSGTQSWLVTNTSWIYVLAVATILIFSIWLMFSRLGEIKLGPDDSTPSYGNLSWFAMLFSAGMGIGLLFFGVAEPIMHFSAPPVGDPLSVESAREAMKITFFHWGLHAWAIYAVLAVMLAYYCYRKNLPLLPRSLFYPVLGDKINGPIGSLIDIFCIIGTMFGVATSLGLGVTQVNAGLHYLFDLPISTTVQVTLIALITGMATISVVLGLDGGIKRLSNINMILAVILLISVLLLGPTVELLKSFVQNMGAYASDLTFKTFNLYTYEKKESWIGGWTLLYWGWWVSWAPFVGMFIARISRGRTIREFMAGVLFIPTGFTCLWMTVFGNTAISKVLDGGAEKLVDAVNNNVPVALFQLFEYLPFSSILSLVGLFLVITFFVSSSDSGSLVIDTLASGGVQEPPVWQRVYWAVMEGLVAATLLLAGGLDALQTMTIASAFPMIFIILIAMVIFVKNLKEDHLLFNTVQTHRSSIITAQGGSKWQERLDALITHPKYEDALDFLKSKAEPALEELCEHLKKKGFDAFVDLKVKDTCRLVIKNQGVENFNYGVRLRTFDIPDYAPEDGNAYYRAEVFLFQGGQEYDVYGYSKDHLIADAISQFEKHYHFLHKSNHLNP